MCDYSLHSYLTRLGVEGESLVVHRFTTGSIGLASPSELESTEGAKRGFLAKLRSWFDCQMEPQIHAVCIPPGARLQLRDIPERIRREYQASQEESVTFVQLSDAPYMYRDGVRFLNGNEVLLQMLDEGQRVDVVSVGCSDYVPLPEVDTMFQR